MTRRSTFVVLVLLAGSLWAILASRRSALPPAATEPVVKIHDPSGFRENTLNQPLDAGNGVTAEARKEPTAAAQQGGVKAADASDTSKVMTEEERQWMKKWGALAVGELSTANDKFALQLTQLATPVWDEYQARGEYELLGVGEQVSVSNWDSAPLTAVRMLNDSKGDRRNLKITIKEAEYPELYALQRENLWMRARVEELKRLAALR
jgi:hypothetical protein